MAEQELQRFRRQEARHLRPRPPATAAELMARQPDLPGEVAEYFARDSGRAPLGWSDFFAGVESEEQLEALSDLEVYAARLAAKDHVTQIRRRLDLLITQYPKYADQLAELRDRQGDSWTFTVFGCIEAQGRAYVLFGHSLPEDASVLRSEPIPHVAVLLPSDEGWRIATDPSPYSGMLYALGPVPVRDEEGNEITLDLDEDR